MLKRTTIARKEHPPTITTTVGNVFDFFLEVSSFSTLFAAALRLLLGPKDSVATDDGYKLGKLLGGLDGWLDGPLEGDCDGLDEGFCDG